MYREDPDTVTRRRQQVVARPALARGEHDAHVVKKVAPRRGSRMFARLVLERPRQLDQPPQMLRAQHRLLIVARPAAEQLAPQCGEREEVAGQTGGRVGSGAQFGQDPAKPPQSTLAIT